MPIRLYIALFLALTPLFSHAESTPATLKKEIDQLVDPQLATDTAILVKDLRSGKIIYQFNPIARLKPASVMKLVTSSVALATLGPDYRWKTALGLHGISKGKVKTLSIRGSGDPSLTTESLWMLARRVHKAGVRNINNILLDDSSFSQQKQRSGSRAYEGGSSALAFNFNSLGFEVCPGKVGKPATVVSDPWELDREIEGQVMTVARQGDPVAVEDKSSCSEKGCRLAFEVGGTVAVDSPCIELYRSIDNPREYFGKVLVKFLRQLGIAGDLDIHFGTAPTDPDIAIAYTGHSLYEVLAGLNNFSTNVTAEQIVYAIGADSQDLNFSYQRGLERMAAAQGRVGTEPDQVVIVDGSGLSHDNRLSATAIVNILAAQYDNQRDGIEFLASLAVWGRSGTLKKREPLPEGIMVRGKTGSLDGVSALAGYIFRENRSPLAFAVLQNRVASKAKAVDIEDAVIESLARSRF